MNERLQLRLRRRLHRGAAEKRRRYQFLDLTPWGRNEDELKFLQAWWRRHDEYDKR